MKKGIIFLAILAALGISFALLLNLGVRANSFTFWIVLILLPLAGWIAAKTNFQADD